MTFVSLSWLGWMAGTCVVFWAAPARLRMTSLVVLTAAFLAWTEPVSLVLLAAMTALIYLLTKGPRPSGRRVAIAVVPILAILVGYKAASAARGDDLITTTLIPLGLSYYTLRCIHYALERYKGSIRDLGPREVVEYLFFLPTIFVGPIHRFGPWRQDRTQHRIEALDIGIGLERIVEGYVKIAFLGNFVVSGLLVDWAESVTTPGSRAELYLRMVTIGLNLYFQFSGFSDVAIGFARLLGFEVMENFDWPFLKRNISEFWNSWHMSLTSWSRDYVYTPTIASTRSPALGALASLVAIALWHELSLRYLIWGAYHGLGIVVWQRTRPLWRRLPQVDSRAVALAARVVSTVVTVHFVLFGFLLVRQSDLASMGEVTKTLLGW